MHIQEFIKKLEILQQQYDKEIGRKYNRDSFFHGIRTASRYLTYIFYKLGLRGHHVLVLHFLFDIIALYCVALDKPLYALVFWFSAHVMDNCDGDLARIRNEADLKWGKVDIHLHLLANMLFWFLMAFKTSPETISVILASRVVCEFHRNRIGSGIKSKGRWESSF